jgi:eukaryotic-like serine/threonine-protein kinase
VVTGDSTGLTIPAELDLEPGLVVGEYRIESQLGRGAFGTVYKASHPLIGKLVAIKVLARKYSVDPEMIERFVAEARAVNQIRHRNIIDIFSFGTLDDGRAYYVMELLEGEPLDHLLAREGHLALEIAVPILRGIGRALDAAHAKGIAHRDLKPDNVFLANNDGEPFPKLLDFGIAKLLTDETSRTKTRTGMAIGTPYYMSPEQARGKNVDHRTDYYAFGVVAYQLLTGVVPIDDADYMAILMRQITDEPVPPSQRVAELPVEVDHTIAWLMRKDPAERPPSLGEAVRALELAAGMEPSVGSGRRSGVAAGTIRTPVPGQLTRAPSAPAARVTPTDVLPVDGATPTEAAMRAAGIARRRRWPVVAGVAAVVAGAVIAVAVAVGGSGEQQATPQPMPQATPQAVPVPTPQPQQPPQPPPQPPPVAAPASPPPTPPTPTVSPPPPPPPVATPPRRPRPPPPPAPAPAPDPHGVENPFRKP